MRILVAFFAMVGLFVAVQAHAGVVREQSGFVPLGVYSGVAYATGQGQSSTLYRSTDEGANWSVLANLPGYILALNQTRSGALIAGVNDGYYSLYRSTDGVSWLPAPVEYPSNQGQLVSGFRGPGNQGYYLLLGKDSMVQTDAGLFAVTYNTNAAASNQNYLYRSVDDGRSWQIIYRPTEFRHGHGMTTDGNTLFILWGDSAGDGVWRSDDNGFSWNPVCTAYSCVAVSAVVVNGSLYYESDNPVSSGSGQNGIYRVTGGVQTKLVSTTHVSYSAATSNGQVVIGETYEPYTSRQDPNVHLWIGDGSTFTDTLQRAIPAAEGNWHLRAVGWFPSGNMLVQTPTGFLVLGAVAPPPAPTPKSDSQKVAFLLSLLTAEQTALYNAWLAS